MSNPFAPIGGKGAKVAPSKPDWLPVLPIPDDASQPPSKHPTVGEPSCRWDYLDGKGRLLGFVCRFDRNSGKQYRPLTLWFNPKTNAMEWRWESWPAPRPLYGLHDLATAPGAPAILCEGEKSADAAKRLLPGYVAVTSPGGAQSAAKADWAALKGRHVTIWPDADPPGLKYANAAAAACAAAGAASIAIVAPPSDVTPGWDAADAESEGWTTDRIKALIDAAVTVEVPQKEAPDNTKKERRRRPPARDGLIALTEFCDLWHGTDGTAYVTFPVNGHGEKWKVRSDRFRRWLTGRAYDENGSVPGGQAIEDALRFFEGRATNDGPEYKPRIRTGERDGLLYIDLCDSDWCVIEVCATGWRILKKHDLPFYRTSSMLPLPEPRTGGSIEQLRAFVNVSDDDEFKMVVAWLLAALWHRGEYPILIVQGEQGSGKSTFSRLLRSLVDPSVAPIRAPPKDEEDLLIAAKNSHCLMYDNMSGMPVAMADWLCRVSTGGGFSTRTKFTNDEEYVIWTCNPILVNGIPALADRPDLARRSLIVHLKAIPEEQRQPEDEFWQAWELVRPSVFGALLDGLATAIDNLPHIKLDRYQSMAAFEKLIEAASPALGWDSGAFSRTYAANRLDLDGASYEASPVATAMGDLIADQYQNGWSGTATRLLELLCERVTEQVKRSHGWPKTAQGLGNQIDRVKPLLRSRGIIIERRHSGERTITIVPKSAGTAP